MEYASPVMPFRLRNVGPVIAAIPHDKYPGEYAVAIQRPDMEESRAYSTHVVKQDDRGFWVTMSKGHYDLSRADAIADMIARSGTGGHAR